MQHWWGVTPSPQPLAGLLARHPNIDGEYLLAQQSELLGQDVVLELPVVPLLQREAVSSALKWG
eukprot:SAG11_NODE_27300_length_334_cov_0.817021_2_plen_63_part_01